MEGGQFFRGSVMNITHTEHNTFVITFSDGEMELLEKTERLKPKGIITFLFNTIRAGMSFLKHYFK